MKKISLSLFLFGNLLNAYTLTVNECINTALDTHPDIKIAQQNIKINKLQHTNIIGDYLPQISLDLEYNPTKTVVLPVNGELNTIDTDGYMANINLKQRIWDFGRTTDSLKINHNDLKISKYLLNDKKSLLAYKIKVQYELMFFYKKVIEVKRQDLFLKEEYYKKAREQANVGEKTHIEEKRFLTSVYNAEDALKTSILDYKKSKYTLSNYIGIDLSDKEIELVNTHTASKKIVQVTLDNSPGIKILKEEIRKQHNSSSLAYKSHFGSIDLKANLSYQNSINEYDTSYVGVSLNIPIYNGGKISNQVQISRINELKSKYKLEAQKRNMLEDINNSLIDVQKFRETISTKKLQINNSVDTLDIIKERWKVGMATYIEVLDANSILLNSRLDLLKNKFNLNQTIHKIEFLNGEIK